jgi:UDP-glucose 4-epimerase
MKKILITGVAGLLGSHFSRYLLDKGFYVIGIDDFSGGYKDFLPNHPNFKIYKKTIGIDDISHIFTDEKPFAVFHFAAYAAEGLSPFIRCFNYQNNIIASSSIINECIKNKCKLIFTSSMAVYGDQSPPFNEEMKQMPIDPYGIAKYAIEQDIIIAGKQFGLQYNIIRPHNVVGIYQNIWDKYRNVIGIFIRRVLNSEPMIVYGDGEQTRAFSDIEYYMEPFEKLIENFNGEIINIGADKYFSLNEVANLVKEIASQNNIESSIVYGEKRHEAKHAYCNHDKAKNILNFHDKTNLKQLISEMFVWAKNQPNREVKKINYEIEENIYEYWRD